MNNFDFLKASASFQFMGLLFAIVFLLMYIAFWKKEPSKK
ncbi:MAG: hypothetical protein ACD_26C00134G0006 [uncultured bacterium]|nr:MAG: hypothetical protein ACD_26C00134G0006 [uncultured bacterium]